MVWPGVPTRHIAIQRVAVGDVRVVIDQPIIVCGRWDNTRFEAFCESVCVLWGVNIMISGLSLPVSVPFLVSLS